MRAVALAASLVLALGSCRDHPAGPQAPRIVSLGLAPRFAVSAGANDLTIDRVRLRAVEQGTGVVLGELETNVDPAAQSWPLTLEVKLEGGRSTDVVVTIELLHAAGVATPSVEWSGRTAPITVSAGSSSEIADVALGRGSLDNLAITDVAIAGQPPTLVEGDSVTLAASATGAVGTPQFFWNSLDGAVATVDAAGKVRTLRDGTAPIVAAAGTHADTMVVTATQRVATITMSVDTLRLASIGATGTITATPLDPRGATVAGATLQWTVVTPGIVTDLGNGQFRADTAGATQIVVTANGFTAEGHAVVAVIQTVAFMQVTPNPATVNVQGTTQLSVAMYDASEHLILGRTATWTSRDAAVATVSASGLVTGVAQGTTWIVAAAGSVQDSTQVTVSAGAAASVAVFAGDNQTATVNTGVATAPAVQVRDGQNNPVPGVNVTFAVTAGGGSLVGAATVATDTIGVATVGGWVLGTAAGGNTLTATVAGLPAVTFTATGTAGAPATVVATSGNNQNGTAGTALPQPLVVTVADAFANPVSGALVTWTPSAGTVSPATANTAANGTAQTTWTPGFGPTSQTVTATVGTLTPATFAANVTQPAPTVQLALQTVDKVSVGRQATIGVTLTQPAPAGGTTVTVTSGTPTVLGIVTGTTTVAAGSTTGAITVSGVSEGTSLLSATATGYDPGSLSVAVELRLIGMQATFSVPFGQSASIPITLARPAPSGGITLSVVSSDPATVGVANPTYFIPAGAQSVNAVLTGVQPGTAQVVASHPFYDPDTVVVTSAASLNITAGSISFNQSFGSSMTIGFESNGTPVPAPSPGVTIALAAADPGCVTVPATATIATGLVNVTVPLSYGGTTATQCNTYVRATATNITPDSTMAYVAPTPPITLYDQYLGKGLQKQIYGYLGASNHPGETVRLRSLDPSRVVLAIDANTVGLDTLQTHLTAGATYFYYYIQAIEGTPPPDSVLVEATTLDGLFRPDTQVIRLLTPALDVQGVPTATTSLAADNNIYARTGIATPGYNYISESQALRAGHASLTVSFHITDTTIAHLIDAAGVHDSVRTAQIGANGSYTPTSVATGGIALHPVGNGTATVSVTAPGFGTLPTSAASVTVSTPTMNVGARYVGAGLQVQHSGYLASPAPAGGTVVHIVSSNAGLVQLAASDTSIGGDSVLVTVPAGQQYFYFYVQGVEGQPQSSVPVTVTAAQFAPTSFSAELRPAVFDLQGVPGTTTTLSSSNALYARLGIDSYNYGYITEQQVVRAHGTPLTVTFTANHPEVAALFTSADTTALLGSVQATIPVRSYLTPTSVATGGVGMRPVAAGGDTITASIPGLTGIGGTEVRVVTVSAPRITIPQFVVGSGLMKQGYLYLETPVPGGTTVWIRSTDSTVLRLAPDATTAASDSIAIAVPANQTYVYFYVHGMEGQRGTPSIVAGAQNFTTGTTAQSVVQPRFDVAGLNQNIRTLDPDNPFYVRVGLDTYGYGYITEGQYVRFGGQPLTATISTTNTGVGYLKTTSDSAAAQVTVQIPVGQYTSPTTVATGGVAHDPQTQGQTFILTSIPGFTSTRRNVAVDSLQVDVTAPALSVANTTVGAGLEAYSYVSLASPAPAGLRLTIRSSQPAVALVSAYVADSVGRDSVVVDVPTNATTVYFYVHGVDGQTGTVTISASAPGYSDGTGTATIVQPYVAMNGIGTSMAAGSSDQSFYVVVGPMSYYGNTVDGQMRRAGAAPLVVTVTNSDTTVAKLVDATGVVVPPRTLSIVPGSYYTPTSISTGGLAFRPAAAGTTTVSASIPGFTQITDPNSGATRAVTVTPPPAPPVGGAQSP